MGCFLCAMVGSNVMGCDIPPHQTEELAEFAKRHHRLGVGEAISVSFIRSSPTYMKDSWEYYCSYTFRARFKVKIAPSPNYHCENIIEITKDVTSPHGEDPTHVQLYSDTHRGDQLFRSLIKAYNSLRELPLPKILFSKRAMVTAIVRDAKSSK